MSDIKVGDLVVAVRGCDGCECHFIGLIFRVTQINFCAGIFCDNHFPPNYIPSQVVAFGYGKDHTGQEIIAPVAWLRKIDPPAETESTEHERELTV